MTKEEILKKSRIDNNGNDPYEKQIDKKCDWFERLIMDFACIVFWAIEFFKNDNYDLRFFLILLISTSLGKIMKALYIRNRENTLKALRSTILPIVLIITSIVKNSFFL